MNRSSFSSLRARLILLVLLSLLPAFGIIFYEARQERLYATVAAEEKALGLARSAVAEQRRLISDTRRVLGRLAQERRWGLTDPTTCSTIMADHLKQHPGYLNLGVINLKGDLLCSALPLKNPVNAGDRLYFRRTVETKDFSIGEYQIGRVTGKATLNFGFPDFDDSGRLLAVVFAALDLTAIEQVFVNAKRDEGSVFLMLDLKGTVLSRYPHPDQWVGKRFSDPSVLKAIHAKQGEIKGQAGGQDGIERLYAFIALRSGGEVAGFAGIGIPAKAAFAEANRNLLNSLVLIGLVSALILVTTWVGGNLFVLEPVNALVRATKRLGIGDLTARTGLPHRQDELGQLARSFDEMADAVQILTRRNELILTSAGEGIYGVDLEGKTTFINPAAAKMLGYEPSELVGQAMHALAHHSKPDGTPYPKEECPIYATFSDGAVHHVDDEVFWRKDGTSFSVDFVSTPVREDGKILGAVVTLKDVTERKKAEEALQARYQELLTLHETSQTILISPDLKTTLEKVLDKTVSNGSFDLGIIRLVDPGTQTIQPIVYQGYRDLENVQRHHHRSIAATTGRFSTSVLADRQPRVEENVPQCEGLRTFKREGVQSALVIPVMTEKEVLGVLQLGSRTSRKFHPNEIRLAQTIGNQIGIAVQKARFYEETQHNLERIRALHEIGKAISSTLDLSTILKDLLEKIDLFFPLAAASTLRLLNKETGELEPVACRNLNEKEWKAATQRVPGGVARMLPKNNAPVAVLNAQTDPRSLSPELLRKHGLVSYLRIPMIVKDDLLGMLTVFTKEEHEFADEEIEFLTTLAAQAAIAIHNSQLHGQAQRNFERIRALHEIDNAIISTLDLRTVLDVLLEKIDLVLSYSAATVRLFNKESGLLEPVACRNLDEKEWKAEGWRGGRGLANIVFETNAPTIIRNAQADPRVRDSEFYRKHKLVSYLGVPLIAKDKAFGVLGFYTKEEHEFSQEEIEFLNTIAGQAAIAIYNARLFEETKSQAIDLERSNKVKDEFLSVISHELRTPLNVIMGYTTLLQDRTLGEVHPEQQDALGKIAHQSQTLLLLVNSILDVTLLETQREHLVTHEVNIDALISEVRANCALPPQKKFDIVWVCAPDLSMVKTDSKKLQHILQNLIHNAIKFTEEGRITVSAKFRDKPANGAASKPRESSVGEPGKENGAGEKWLEVKVTDTGVGIPSEAMSRIFDKFYQADSSATRGYEGMGLGLYIVKQFTELLDGYVEVESEKGKGSTFTVSIPVHS